MSSMATGRNAKCITHEGQSLAVKMQVADVHKLLVSVAKLTDSGNSVVFDKEVCYKEKE